MHFSPVFFALAFLKLANGASLSGQATFYGGNLAGGACSFSTYTLPSGVFGTALSDSNWDTSGNCGACVSVTGPSGDVITAMIVDECPGCGTNHLDLFPDAFSTLADPSKGVIPITWNYVNCPITTPLVVHNKDGVSAYWFSMQVVNANKGVKSLEVSTDGGSTWQATARQDYNFFENSMGFGTTTVDVKVTSVDGDVVIVKDVNVSSGDSTTASSNFGSAAAPVAEQPMSTFSAIPLESYTSTTSTVEESTPAPTPNPEATESSLGTTTTTLPGGNFVETTAEAKTTAESPTSTHSTAAASTAASDTYTPSTSYSAEKTTSSTSTITQTKTKTKTEIPSTTLSTTAAPVRPTSLAAGIITNTTTTYPITSVGTSSSRLAGSSSLTLGLAATPSSSPLPFTGSASHSVAQFGGLFASLVLAVFNAF